MGMKHWKRFKDWWGRTPEKRGLDVGEIFFRLRVWQRCILVLICAITAYKFLAPVFAMNVGPHGAKLWNPDGTFNHAEWSIVENQSAGIVTLAIGGLLLMLRWLNLFQKGLIVIAMIGAFWMNVSTGTAT